MVSLESISCFSQSNTRIVGWGGLAILLFLYDHLNEFQLFLYRGGILLTAIPTALLKIDTSSPVTLLSKVLQTRILPG